MRSIQLIGLILLRGGLLLAGGWSTFETARWVVRLLDVPTQIEGFEGRSFLSLMRGVGDDFPVKHSFAQRRPAASKEKQWGSSRVYSLQDDRYKYILFTEEEDQFYDLRSDPLELSNLTGDSDARSGMREELLAELERLRADGRAGGNGSSNDTDLGRYQEELRALGYVE